MYYVRSRLVILTCVLLSTVVANSSEIPEKRIFNLNPKVNPCDNFHAYVCSNVEENFKLREDRSSHTFSFSDSRERLLEKKKEFFLNIDSEKKLSPRSQQFKSYYKACMNEKAAAEEEKEMVSELKKTVEQMKTLEDYIAVNKTNMTGVYWSFISYDILPNVDQPKVYDISFDINYMFLPEHSYYDNPELIKAYAQLITDFFVVLYPEGKKDELAKRAQAVVDFEKRFKDFYPKPEEFRARWTQPVYLDRAKFFQLTDKVGLQEFFKKNVPVKTLIRDFIPESFTFIQKELKPENLQVLKDIYLFRNARNFMDDAYPDLFKKRLDFSFKYLGGPPVRSERQERCTTSTMDSFSKEIDQEMIGRLFKNFPQQKIIDVTNAIRQSILAGIQKNTWLSAESKKGALEKTQKAKLQIIQPRTAQEWDFKPIQKYSDTKTYENDKKLSMLSHKRRFERMRKGVNQEAWGMSPMTVNAYYDPTANKFVMPIGILQYPFFVPEGDLIENLGAVGAVVGHELGHGIDDQGSKFNAQGQLKQWMSAEDIKKFQARGEKMVEQFAKIGHNGKLTLGENVADLVGITFAYHAAFPDASKVTVENQKKFFVANARLWCGVMREKTKEMLLKTDEHSLGSARINEQMKHQPGFQHAFSCKKGDKLYLDPSEQIQIW